MFTLEITKMTGRKQTKIILLMECVIWFHITIQLPATFRKKNHVCVRIFMLIVLIKKHCKLTWNQYVNEYITNELIHSNVLHIRSDVIDDDLEFYYNYV